MTENEKPLKDIYSYVESTDNARIFGQISLLHEMRKNNFEIWEIKKITLKALITNPVYAWIDYIVLSFQISYDGNNQGLLSKRKNSYKCNTLQ